MQTKCIIFGEGHKIRVKKFKHNLPENYSKSTKIAISLQHVNFQKFLGGACPRTPLELSWFNQLQISSAEKNTLEKMWKLCPPFFKFLATPLPFLVVDEENLVIGFGPPHFRNAYGIAAFHNWHLFGWDPKKSLTALELDILSSSLQYKKENKSSWSSAVSES